MSQKSSDIKHVVLVCTGSDCRDRGSEELRKAVKRAVKKGGSRREVLVLRTGCTGMCKRGPIMCIQPANVWLEEATTRTALKKVDEHILR